MRKIGLIIGCFLLCAIASSLAFGQTPTLVNVNTKGTSTANGGSAGAPYFVSAKGRFVVFTSYATNLVTIRDSNSAPDVFLRDLQAGTTTMVSVNYNGTAASGGGASASAISPNGRYVLFTSSSRDLVSIDPGSTNNIYIRDVVAGTTTLVSINKDGTGGGNAVSRDPVMSSNGLVVAFKSEANNLVNTNDGLNTEDIFVRDLQTQTTTLASINLAGSGTGNGASFDPVISGQGRFVAFSSGATNLTGISDTNRLPDIFVRDLLMETTALVTVNSAGTRAANGVFWRTTLSDDGRFVAFTGGAPDIVANLTTGSSEVFVRDLVAGSTSLVSINTMGTGGGDDYSRFPVITGNGRYIVFRSRATNLVKVPDPNRTEDIFVRDLQKGMTTLVTVNKDGTETGGCLCFGSPEIYAPPAISADGRFVAFYSHFTNLVAYHNNQAPNQFNDVFVRDMLKKTTTLVSINSAGNGVAKGDSDAPILSADGKTVIFRSFAKDLVTNDDNTYADLFAFKLTTSDVAISMTDSADPVLMGEQVTYTLKVINKGPEGAAGVVVTDILPSTLSFLSANSSVGNCSQANGTVTCNIGSLASGATATINLNARATASGAITHKAGVAHNVADPYVTNNVAAQKTNVVKLLSLTLSQSSNPGCNGVVGVVKLSGPAPAGGAVVALKDNIAAATTPSTVTIPSGAISTNFTITTTPVTSAQSGTVEATLGPITLSQALTIRPTGVLSLTLNPNPVVGPNTVIGTVTLECPAPPGGLVVSLLSSTPAIASPTVGSITIPPGVSSKTFNVMTTDVSVTKSVTIKATANGITKSQVLKVNP